MRKGTNASPGGADTGLYNTPARVTDALMRRVSFEGLVLEPCCGTGAMARRIALWNEVEASDLVGRGYGGVADFLRRTRPAPNVVTNPPFGKAERFIAQALRVATRKVALLLPCEWLIRPAGRPFVRPGGYLRNVYFLLRRPKFDGYSPPWELAWFVWEVGYMGKFEPHWVP
jgi:hypothetical protein